MNADEKRHLNKLAEMGCIICGAPANIHHPRFCVGMSQRSPHFLGIALCPWHHQQGPYGQSIHSGQAAFEKNFGTEAELLSETIRKMVK